MSGIRRYPFLGQGHEIQVFAVTSSRFSRAA